MMKQIFNIYLIAILLLYFYDVKVPCETLEGRMEHRNYILSVSFTAELRGITSCKESQQYCPGSVK